jgi:hypothetical protein
MMTIIISDVISVDQRRRLFFILICSTGAQYVTWQRAPPCQAPPSFDRLSCNHPQHCEQHAAGKERDRRAKRLKERAAQHGRPGIGTAEERGRDAEDASHLVRLDPPGEQAIDGRLKHAAANGGFTTGHFYTQTRPFASITLKATGIGRSSFKKCSSKAKPS